MFGVVGTVGVVIFGGVILVTTVGFNVGVDVASNVDSNVDFNVEVAIAIVDALTCVRT